MWSCHRPAIRRYGGQADPGEAVACQHLLGAEVVPQGARLDAVQAEFLEGSAYHGVTAAVATPRPLSSWLTQ